MTAIAYGRVSSPKQVRDQSYRRQIKAIKNHFHISDMDFDYDETSNKHHFHQHKALIGQLRKAAAYEVPLYIEHSDRLTKSDNDKIINAFFDEIRKHRVRIRYAYPNTQFHQRIFNILSDDISTTRQRRLLTRIIDQYLDHRHLIVTPDGNPDPLPKRESNSTLENLTLFLALTQCADHILRLDPTLDWNKFRFFVDAYLGAAYNHKFHLNRQHGHKSVPTGQRTYGEHPDHATLFDAIHEIASQPHVTLYNRPKRVSDAIVARIINDRGYRNLRGNTFSRKSVWQLRRRNRAYQKYVNAHANPVDGI